MMPVRRNIVVVVCVMAGVGVTFLVLSGLPIMEAPRLRECLLNPQHSLGIGKMDESTLRSKEGLDLVMVFPLMTDNENRIGGYSAYSLDKLRERQMEYVCTLRRNLQHHSVSRVHLLSHQPSDLSEMLENQSGIDFQKISIVKSSKDVTYTEVLEYASDYLRGHFVNIMNADNYLGEGFSKLNWTYLRQTRVMYSLTRRHLKPIPVGCSYGDWTLASYCESGSEYRESHDCFIFYVNGPFPESFLAETNYASSAVYGENLLIWAFENILKYKVLNPCKILSIHHNHCSDVRPVYRETANSRDRHGHVPFSASLYVHENEK